jgi:hypothetical protein
MKLIFFAMHANFLLMSNPDQRSIACSGLHGAIQQGLQTFEPFVWHCGRSRW